jgi:hypothetical protein
MEGVQRVTSCSGFQIPPTCILCGEFEIDYQADLKKLSAQRDRALRKEFDNTLYPFLGLKQPSYEDHLLWYAYTK